MTPFYNSNYLDTITISEIYKKSNIYLYPYARYAFLEALIKLKIRSVYLPAFICRDMLAPINTLGLEYSFYHCDETLQPILEDIKCDAIVMVNYFGFANDIRPFEIYKEKYHSLIIEDNAHGFLSKDSQGNLLGIRGDMGLLSIRKTIFLPNGGALLVNSGDLKTIQFDSAEIKQSDEDIRYYQKLNLKKKIFHYSLGIAILLVRRFVRYIKTGSTIPLPNKQSEYQMPSNKYLTPILANGKIDIDILQEMKKHQDLYIQVGKWAKKFDIEPIYQFYNESVPYEFAFIDRGNYKEFERFLLRKGFFVLPWPELPDEIVGSCPEFYKNIKVVPFLW
jgi:hypothetical protein